MSESCALPYNIVQKLQGKCRGGGGGLGAILLCDPVPCAMHVCMQTAQQKAMEAQSEGLLAKVTRAEPF